MAVRSQLVQGFAALLAIVCALLLIGGTDAHAAAPVSGVWVMPGSGSNTISWEPSAGNTHYRVYRSVTAGAPGSQIAGSPVAHPNSSIRDASGVLDGVTYYYTVRGWDGAAESGDPAVSYVDTGADFSSGWWWDGCSAELNGAIYTFGGYRGGLFNGTANGTIRRFDAAASAAADTGHSVPNNRYWCGAARSGGALYVGGGADGTNCGTRYSQIYRYDGTAAPSLRNGTLPTNRCQLSAATLADGTITFIGGENGGSNFFQSLARFDPVADPAGAIPSDESELGYGANGVQAAGVDTIDGDLQILGGKSGGSNAATDIVKSVEVTFTPFGFTRSDQPDLAANRFRAGAAELNDRMFIFGGATTCSFSCTPTNDISSFSPRTGAHADAGIDMHAARFGTIAHRIKGFIYVSGGNNGNLLGGTFDTAIHRFDPGGQAAGTPGAPQLATAASGVSAVPGSGQASISWIAGTSVDYYRIFRSTASGVLGSLIEEQSGGQSAPATGIVDAGLGSCTTYWYTVAAVGYDGHEAAHSSQASALTPGPCSPAAHTQFQLDGSTPIASGAATYQDGVVLRFDVRHTASGQTLTPWVEVRTSPGAFAEACGASVAGVTFSGSNVAAATALQWYPASVTVTGLAAGQTYYWRACTTDGAAQVSAWSAAGGSPDFETLTMPPGQGYFLRNSVTSTQLTGAANRAATTASGTGAARPSINVQANQHGRWYLVRPDVTGSTVNVGGIEPPGVPYNDPNGSGWVIDASTGQSYRAGPIAITIRSQHASNNGVGTLQCRAWRVSASGGVVTSSTLLGTSPVGGDVLQSGLVSRTCVPAVLTAPTQLAADESIYVELWLNVTTADTADRTFSIQGEGADSFITLPLAAVQPDAPALVTPADAASVGATPMLTATYAHPNATDGAAAFQIATTAGFGASIVQQGSSATVADGAPASWTAASLTPGTYHWRSRGVDEDGIIGAWSVVRTFTVTGPSVGLTIDVPELDLGTPLPGEDVFATGVATVTTTNPSGYELTVLGTATGTDASTCTPSCAPLVDWAGTSGTPTVWSAGEGGYAGITVRDAQDGRMSKWGPGTGTAENDVDDNRFAGVPAAGSVVLHERATAVTDDDIVFTVRVTPSLATGAGTHTETLELTVVANP